LSKGRGSGMKSGFRIGYVTILWVLAMIGIDRSSELTKDTKVVIFDRANFAWVAKNFSAPFYYPSSIFDAEPPLMRLPPLKELARDTRTDEELITSIVRYFESHRQVLQDKWQERDVRRAEALFVMNLIHVSHPYGRGPDALTLVDYANRTPVSSCELYSRYQGVILDAFKLPWRYMAISSGFHGWIEVEINSRWEIFDATANVWIDRSTFDLLAGQTRRYRLFYTPWADAQRPDARKYVTPMVEPHYYTPGALRSNMPGLGIYFMSEQHLRHNKLRIELLRRSCSVFGREPRCLVT
jgi:hypothetical protein